jgi:subtilase family serine protease
MFGFVRGITFWSALVGFGIVFGGLATRASGEQTTLIVGNHSPSIGHLGATHPAPADQLIQMRIALNPSNRPALDALKEAQQDPASPAYHRWLKRGEFDQRFGPDPALRAAIVQWLTAAGFTVS